MESSIQQNLLLHAHFSSLCPGFPVLCRGHHDLQVFCHLHKSESKNQLVEFILQISLPPVASLLMPAAVLYRKRDGRKQAVYILNSVYEAGPESAPKMVST